MRQAIRLLISRFRVRFPGGSHWIPYHPQMAWGVSLDDSWLTRTLEMNFSWIRDIV